MRPIYDQVTYLLTTKFQVPSASIRPEATLEELDVDSLAVTELVMSLQELYGVPLEDDETTTSLTLSEIVEWIESKVGVSEPVI